MDAILRAFLEKYAWGAISPTRVMSTVEKRKAVMPARTELDRRVNSTLIPTLPHKTVVRIKYFL